jgi:hypothetical protein
MYKSDRNVLNRSMYETGIEHSCQMYNLKRDNGSLTLAIVPKKAGYSLLIV